MVVVLLLKTIRVALTVTIVSTAGGVIGLVVGIRRVGREQSSDIVENAGILTLYSAGGIALGSLLGLIRGIRVVT